MSGRCSVLALLLLLATPASARLLHVESVLESQAALPPDTRRLEFGSSYFGASAWAGHRHSLRYAGSRGDHIAWSLTLPWLYSSLANGGRAGRDNLLLGSSLRLAHGEAADLRLAGDFWLPFASEDLAPLALRRAFGRLALIGAQRGALDHAAALSYCWEVVGVGPETEGGAWPRRWDLALRSGKRPASGWGLFISGCLSRQQAADEDLTFGSLGGGVTLAWDARWCAELGAESTIGAEDIADRADYRVRLTLRRDVALPPPDAKPEPTGDPGMGAPSSAEP